METTKLTLEVEYDPRFTDPEGLACTMDRLLETALSTPGIMDNYANPTVGEFFVDGESVRAPAINPLVVLMISGGVLQAAYASGPGARLILTDWDAEGSDPNNKNLVEIEDRQGRHQCVFVTDFPIAPLTDLSGTDTGHALDKAGIRYIACEPKDYPSDEAALAKLRELGFGEP